MTDAEPRPAPELDGATDVMPRSERLQFALRQAGLVTVALLVAGLVAARLRPDDVADRGFVSAIFLWAIVVWLIVLLANAAWFGRSHVRDLEGPPLIAAAVIGVVVLLTGLLRIGGSAILYLFATALGTAMFWWGLLSLGLLLVSRLSSS